MSTCKDCIHGDVCKAHVIEGMGIDFTTFEKLVEKNGCDQFKDRSKFIELPCKVGDIVYFIKKGKIIKDSVRDINYKSSWKGFEFNTLVDKWYEEDIGHKIYFTLEQAEQAMKKKIQKKH